MDKRVVGAGSATKTEYLVHWKGYTADEDTWEPKQELKNVQPLIVAFESGRGKKSPSSNGTTKTNLPGKNVALLSVPEMRALLAACNQDVQGVDRAQMQTRLQALIREFSVQIYSMLVGCDIVVRDWCTCFGCRQKFAISNRWSYWHTGRRKRNCG